MADYQSHTHTTTHTQACNQAQTTKSYTQKPGAQVSG